MSININLNDNCVRAMEASMRHAIIEAVQHLGTRYGFDAVEALREMKIQTQVEPKKKMTKKTTAPKKASIPLPWCGKVFEENCCGIRVNHGLHTQCSNARHGGEDYCKTCSKQALSTENKKPKGGDIRDRDLDHEWKPVSKLVPYANVMEKLGITREQAEAAATELGMTIPEKEFTVVKGQRGRPKKDKSATSSDEEDETKPKRGRGRPKKTKTVLSKSAGDDLIAQLVSQAQTNSDDSSDDDRAEKEMQTTAEVTVPEEDKELDLSEIESDDGDDVDVELFTHESKQYYINKETNELYDIASQQPIGTWEEKTKSITLINHE